MITDWIMVIITTVYVIATILICIYNGKSASAAKEQAEVAREQIDEMIKQYKEINRPYVTIRFDIIRSGLLCFVVENEGPLPAHNVRIKINQKFIDNIKDVSDRKTLEELNEATIYLASRQKMTIFLGGQPSFSDISKEIAKIDIMYDGYNESTEIDINQYRFLLVYNSSVEDISQHLKKMKQNEENFYKNILKAMDKAPQIQNLIIHNATEDDANKFKIYKTICLEPQMTYIQIAEKVGLDKEYVFNMLLELHKMDRLVTCTFRDVYKNDENALWCKR